MFARTPRVLADFPDVQVTGVMRVGDGKGMVPFNHRQTLTTAGARRFRKDGIALVEVMVGGIHRTFPVAELVR